MPPAPRSPPGCGRELVLGVLLRLLERGVGLALRCLGDLLGDRRDVFLRLLLRIGRLLQRVLVFDQVLANGRDRLVRLLEQFIERPCSGPRCVPLLVSGNAISSPSAATHPVQGGQMCVGLRVATQLDDGLRGRSGPRPARHRRRGPRRAACRHPRAREPRRRRCEFTRPAWHRGCSTHALCHRRWPRSRDRSRFRSP